MVEGKINPKGWCQLYARSRSSLFVDAAVQVAAPAVLLHEGVEGREQLGHGGSRESSRE
jgi:hypothetical protein